MFYDRFTETAGRFPDLIAVELQRESSAGAAGAAPVESYTFNQLRSMSESVGCWLLAQGFPGGSKCAFFAANHPRWTAAYLGVLSSGNTAVPLDTALHADQVRELLIDSDSVLLFCDNPRLAAAREATKDLPVKLVLMDGAEPVEGLHLLSEIFNAGPGDFQHVAVEDTDIALILYTS